MNPLLILPYVPVLLWLFALRPYCRRHGKGYTPGATLEVTFWINWQEASEIAKARGDLWIRIICWLLLSLQILAALLVVFAVIGGAAAR